MISRPIFKVKTLETPVEEEEFGREEEKPDMSYLKGRSKKAGINIKMPPKKLFR